MVFRRLSSSRWEAANSPLEPLLNLLRPELPSFTTYHVQIDPKSNFTYVGYLKSIVIFCSSEKEISMSFKRKSQLPRNVTVRAFSLEDICLQLGVSMGFVKTEIRAGRLVARRLGPRRLVVLCEDFYRYVEQAPLAAPDKSPDSAVATAATL